MILSDLSIKRPIMISMVLIVFLLFGCLAYYALNLELFPDITLPVVTVQTVYEGAGPKEIETQVTKRVEDAVSSISKIDYIRSYSMEGVSYVVIMFEVDKDENVANQEVKDQIDGILNDLPDNSDRPIIQKFDPSGKPVVELVLSGDLPPTELYDLADKILKNRISQTDGVSSVSITGGQEREIRIRMDNRVVYQNSLSLSQIAEYLAGQNLDMPGGYFQQASQDISVRLKGEFTDLDQMRALEIPTGNGFRRLDDMATVTDTGADVRMRTSFFNNIDKKMNDNVVILGVMKSDDGNTVEMAHLIKDNLPELSKLLPDGVSLRLATDDSVFAEDTADDTMSTIFLGIILTALILLLFLHNIRSTIIVGLSMPMSVISTFLLIKISGYSLNMMTLMGLSTAVGILVSNSVVVIENIFTRKQAGDSKAEAASRGTNEVVAAVVAATLTNLVVFLPIANMTSIIGTVYAPFGMTVVYATLFSLLMSFTLVPAMASRILPNKISDGGAFGRWSDNLIKKTEDAYRVSLKWVLANKRNGLAFIGLATAILIGSFWIGGHVGFDFIPRMDEGDINIEVELPLGYRIEETGALVDQIEQKLRSYDQVEYILTTIGQITQVDQGTNVAKVKVKLIPAAKRKETTDQMVTKFIEDFSIIPNANIRVLAVASIGSGQSPVQLAVTGSDMDTLNVITKRIINRIEDIPGLVGLNTSSREGKPEIALYPDRKKLSDAGITVYELAMTLRGAIEGIIATQYRESGEEYDIRVSLNDDAIDTPEEVENLAVVTQKGTFRLGQLARVVFSQGYSKIDHLDRVKMVMITGNNSTSYALGDITNEIDERIGDVYLPAGYHLKWEGNVKLMNETIVDMGRTFIIALILTYMLLAAVLESLTQPLVILATVPLAFIGIFIGLVVSGISMNAISMMAIVMLLGIVVNNAILQLDYTNQLVRKEKKDPTEALLIACPARLRPILMSTLAIILGMLPMALGMGASGREVRQSMGIVSISGLVSSTLLALIIIPVVSNMIMTRKTKKQ
ncbi:MAG TPA: efflux RND transporter permease subunit [candidate division Zixibacteria bacterium]|nr:efflux RND transporter permease subunit [candidate division Zixibacteria bacterium]